LPSLSALPARETDDCLLANSTTITRAFANATGAHTSAPRTRPPHARDGSSHLFRFHSTERGDRRSPAPGPHITAAVPGSRRTGQAVRIGGTRDGRDALVPKDSV